MHKNQDHSGQVTFKNVLLAMRYVDERRAAGKLSIDLETAIQAQGRENIEFIARILESLRRRELSKSDSEEK